MRTVRVIIRPGPCRRPRWRDAGAGDGRPSARHAAVHVGGGGRQPDSHPQLDAGQRRPPLRGGVRARHAGVHDDTSVTITDLYPGDGHYFTVRAETRRNVPSATSDPIVVPTPPEGPLSPSAARPTSTASGSGGRAASAAPRTSWPRSRPTGPTRPPCSRSPWRTRPCGRWPKRPGTTVTYAVRCASSYGLYSPWSDPTVVTLAL